MSEIKIVRTDSVRTHGVVRFYVGRPTALGNPFVIGKDGDRTAVIEKYRWWLFNQIKSKGAAHIMLIRILMQHENDERDIELSCHCAPEACHADVIKKALLWISKS